jgi:hypothetical protein
MQPRWTWRHWVLGGLVVLGGMGATQLAAQACVLVDDGPPRLLGLRLGATPDDVRARFASESFRTELGEDVALVAESPLEAGVLPGARFEFHDGQLVALRLRLADSHPEFAGQALLRSAQTLLHREPEPDGTVSVVLLSRTCPTHRDEALRLAAEDSSALP